MPNAGLSLKPSIELIYTYIVELIHQELVRVQELTQTGYVTHLCGLDEIVRTRFLERLRAEYVGREELANKMAYSYIVGTEVEFGHVR
jgi:hypothetical protein